MSLLPVAPSLGTSPAGEQSFNVAPNVQLTNKQLAAVGYAEGWTNTTDLAEWMHVVHAESGGMPGALGIGGGPGGVGTDQEYSVGLSQINVAASPDLAPGLLTPTTNALAAHQLFAARGWQPWAPSDFAAPPSQADLTAAAQVAGMTPQAVDTLANQANREAIGGITYSPPPYPGTSMYPPALLAAAWPNAHIGGPPAGQAYDILTLGNAAVPGGEPPGTTLPATPPVLPGAATNVTLGGFGGLLQQLDYWLNYPKTVSSGGLLSINVTGLVRYGIRLLVAVPGFIGLLMAAAGGILGALGSSSANKVLAVVPGGTAVKAAAKVG